MALLERYRAVAEEVKAQLAAKQAKQAEDAAAQRESEIVTTLAIIRDVLGDQIAGWTLLPPGENEETRWAYLRLDEDPSILLTARLFIFTGKGYLNLRVDGQNGEMQIQPGATAESVERILAALALRAIEQREADRQRRESMAERDAEVEARNRTIRKARAIGEAAIEKAAPIYEQQVQDRAAALADAYGWPVGIQKTLFLIEWVQGYDTEGSPQTRTMLCSDFSVIGTDRMHVKEVQRETVVPHTLILASGAAVVTPILVTSMADLAASYEGRRLLQKVTARRALQVKTEPLEKPDWPYRTIEAEATILCPGLRSALGRDTTTIDSWETHWVLLDRDGNEIQDEQPAADDDTEPLRS